MNIFFFRECFGGPVRAKKSARGGGIRAPALPRKLSQWS